MEITMKTSDEILVQKILDGDKSSFQILVDQYKRSVFLHAVKTTRNLHDAEDITQDVFVEAYLNLQKLREPAKFGSWLRGITKNLCRMWIRKKRMLSDLEIPLVDLQTEVLEQWIKGQESSESWEFGTELANKLSDDQKSLLKLFYIDNRPCREIAQQMRASETAIRKRLSRIRQQLKTEILEGEKDMNNMIVVSAICVFLLGSALPASGGMWRDDFEDGDFKGWTVVNTRGGNSVWEVESGRLIAERKDLWGSHIILDESISWKNYELEFEAMIEQSLNPKFTFVGIGVRVSDNSKNFNDIGSVLAFNWNGHQGKIIYARAIKGAQEFELVDIVEQPYPVEMNKWYRVKLSAMGNQFRSYIDDVLQREFSFDGYKSGGVLMAAGGCIAHFDNVVISGPEIPNGGPGFTPIHPQAKLTTTWGRIKQVD